MLADLAPLVGVPPHRFAALQARITSPPARVGHLANKIEARSKVGRNQVGVEVG